MTTTAQASPSTRPGGNDSRIDVLTLTRRCPWLPAVVVSVVLLVAGQVISPGFASWGNINQIVAIAAILALASCGQTIVMISGDFGIDLSVGQLMSLTAVVAFMLMDGGTPWVLVALVAVVVIGALFGTLNGVLVAYAKLPALVVTLGTLVIAQGFILTLTSSGTPSGAVPDVLAAVTGHSILGIRYVTIVVAVLVTVLAVFIARSRFGKNLYLVGSNREAARLAGINVRRVVVIAFVVAGVCGGIAGLLLLSYAGTANLDLGGDYLLLTIAASVIGGASLAGGEGRVASSAAGAVALQVITTFLLTIGVSDALRQVITGLLLVGMLFLNARVPRLRQ
ncbi:ABC transporter permease [Mycolicibacterium palauense]|uniref:ABC transporter permease n=1 Tax=Mycolicibacterium palauense TaxID=2034511 RepID=UPI000BFED69B|nr:ABC transporter permease [Mycolicibacterium palauense]